ncbi:unnamed protein product [Orchesella dallaii]|uniref:Uncharacterized protein n=2 Tax=Orchesella dallaii TaxID=48710 RepID=A0ABP1R263_9HEXA
MTLYFSYLVTLLCVTIGFTQVVSDTEGYGPACPVDDPLISFRPQLFNVTLDPVLEINEGSVYGNLMVLGLSTYGYNFYLDTNLFNLDFNITVDELSAMSSYNASGYLDLRPLSEETVPHGNFTGNGFAHFRLNDVVVTGNGLMFIDIIRNQATFQMLNISSIDFTSIAVDLGETFVIDGKVIDWIAWSANFKSNFDYDFEVNKSSVNELFYLGLNTILKQYTLVDMLEFINGEVECETL